jgi:hypothetical protein
MGLRSASFVALVSVVLFTLGQFPRGHPVIPSLHVDLPGAVGPARGSSVREPGITRIDGPKEARKGGVFTISGTAPAELRGPFHIDVHWNARPWQTVAVGSLHGGGPYRGRVRLTRTGMLNIRVVFPNGDQARGSVRVRP